MSYCYYYFYRSRVHQYCHRVAYSYPAIWGQKGMYCTDVPVRIAGQVSEMVQWKHKAVIQGEGTLGAIHTSELTCREQLRNLELGW